RWPEAECAARDEDRGSAWPASVGPSRSPGDAQRRRRCCAAGRWRVFGPVGAGEIPLSLVDRGAPAPVLRDPAPDNVEVELTQCANRGPDAARSDRPVIHAGDCGDLDSGSAVEGLVGEVDLTAVDRPLEDRQLELALQQLEHGAA